MIFLILSVLEDDQRKLVEDISFTMFRNIIALRYISENLLLEDKTYDINKKFSIYSILFNANYYNGIYWKLSHYSNSIIDFYCNRMHHHFKKL